MPWHGGRNTFEASLAIGENSEQTLESTPNQTHPQPRGRIAIAIKRRTRRHKCTVPDPCKASQPPKQVSLTPENLQERPDWRF